MMRIILSSKWPWPLFLLCFTFVTYWHSPANVYAGAGHAAPLQQDVTFTPLSQPQIEQMSHTVAALYEEGMLNREQMQSLRLYLARAGRQFDHGHSRSAIRNLELFVNEIGALTEAGALPVERGQSLIDAAEPLISRWQTAANHEVSFSDRQAKQGGEILSDPTAVSLVTFSSQSQNYSWWIEAWSFLMVLLSIASLFGYRRFRERGLLGQMEMEEEGHLK